LAEVERTAIHIVLSASLSLFSFIHALIISISQAQSKLAKEESVEDIGPAETHR